MTAVSGQILLVDDEANIRRMLGALLKEEGFSVVEAGNGNAALLMVDQADPDVILLGDLNAGPPQFTAFKRIPGIGWAIAGTTTNTRRTKTYDNLLFAWPATGEYLGANGVLDLQATFGLPLENALEVSDHNPVWAAYHPCEARHTQQLPLASQPVPTFAR